MSKNIFFAFIGLIYATVVGLQAWTVVEMEKSECADDIKLVARWATGFLAGAFIPNMIWVYAKSSNSSVWLKSVSVFIWVLSVIGGTLTTGAVLGQQMLHDEVGCDLSEFPIAEVQYGAIVGLCISMGLPHAYTYFMTTKVAPARQSLDNDSEFLEIQKPLRWS